MTTVMVVIVVIKLLMILTTLLSAWRRLLEDSVAPSAGDHSKECGLGGVTGALSLILEDAGSLLRHEVLERHDDAAGGLFGKLEVPQSHLFLVVELEHVREADHEEREEVGAPDGEDHCEGLARWRPRRNVTVANRRKRDHGEPD